MAHVHIKQRGPTRPLGASLTKKVQLVLFLALMTQLTCDAEAMTSCCTRKPHPCALYEFLCRAGARNLTDPDGKLGRLSSDAAAGILTLGKRKSPDTRYQHRLQHLLHSARNQAAGILTVGRRGAGSGLGGARTAVTLQLQTPRRYTDSSGH